MNGRIDSVHIDIYKQAQPCHDNFITFISRIKIILKAADISMRSGVKEKLSFKKEDQLIRKPVCLQYLKLK